MRGGNRIKNCTNWRHHDKKLIGLISLKRNLVYRLRNRMVLSVFKKCGREFEMCRLSNAHPVSGGTALINNNGCLYLPLHLPWVIDFKVAADQRRTLLPLPNQPLHLDLLQSFEKQPWYPECEHHCQTVFWQAAGKVCSLGYKSKLSLWKSNLIQNKPIWSSAKWNKQMWVAMAL